MVDHLGLLRTGFDSFWPEDVPEMIRNVKNAIHHVGVRKHRCKDGKLLEMDIRIHSFMFEGRRAVLGIALYITHARQLEEDLRQAQKMEAIGQLAGGVAHESTTSSP